MPTLSQLRVRGGARVVLLALVIMLVAIASILGLRRWSADAYSLPLPSEIVTLRVVNNAPDFLDMEDFDAPKSLWQPILAGLSPYQPDPRPTGYQGLVYLRITTTNGRQKSVAVHYLYGEVVGAFSIGRRSYRGGNQEQFIEVILAGANAAGNHNGHGASFSTSVPGKGDLGAELE